MKSFIVILAGVLLLTVGYWASADDAAKPDTRPTDLKLFAKDAKWFFNNGKEFPGATGSFELGTDGDKAIGTLTYDFSGGGKYVDAGTRVTVAKAGQLLVSVKSQAKQQIILRVIDSTRQTHQFVLPYTAANDWQQLPLNLRDNSKAHWGGDNDGVIRFPLTQINLGVQNTNDAKSGKVVFADAVTVE